MYSPLLSSRRTNHRIATKRWIGVQHSVGSGYGICSTTRICNGD